MKTDENARIGKIAALPGAVREDKYSVASIRVGAGPQAGEPHFQLQGWEDLALGNPSGFVHPHSVTAVPARVLEQ